ncbi:murein L,D-transpeptidase catalytic domain family protein [Candidatus Electronema sp. JC]|uniref:murein L,D-transpeptidase catalytic domain family protein n=1 Tax=Candidatus Electronema sp. JC TaxID=3401570 RepID=UPI003B43175C
MPFSLLLIACAAAVWTYLEMPFVSGAAVNQAVAAVRRTTGGQPAQGTLIIVDYSQPSQTRRLAVMNLATGRMELYAKVTHGKNSGAVLPDSFSNQEGSLQSSLGLFQVGEAFNGKHGLSLRLVGLEPEKNDKALIRGIVLHAAPYVSVTSMLLNWQSGFRLGRSEGCFALPDDDLIRLNALLVRPAYVYAYGKNEVLRENP